MLESSKTNLLKSSGEKHSLRALPKVAHSPPSGWTRALLDDVAQRASGHTPDQSKPEYWNGGVKWVSLADSAKLDSGYISETDKEISELGIKHSSAVLLKPETVILSRDAGVGKSGVLRTEMAVSQHFIAWDCSQHQVLHPWFLYAWLQLHKPFFERMAVGSTIKTIGLPLFKRLTIDFPPLPEQRRMVEIIATWDEAIDNLDSLCAVKQARINSVSRQLFEPCHPTSTGRAANWRAFELGGVFKERDEPGRDDDRLLSITMSSGVIDREEVGRKDTSNEDKSAYKLIVPGDIGYNTMRMWQGVSGLSPMRGIVSPAYTIVIPDNRNIAARYAAHLFKSRRMIFDFERYSQGLTSDTWSLKFPVFAKIPVFLPPMDVQHKHASAMDALNEEVRLLQDKRASLVKQRRGLIQRLLTGELRVKEAT